MEQAVTIDALRVVSHRPIEAEVTRIVERASWPAVLPEEQLFLRRVAVKGPLSTLGAAAEGRARELASRAVPGASPEAGASDAVRFRSLAELVACLTRDLARGRAEGLWFWRAFRELLQLPREQAIGELWQRHLTELVPVVAALERWGELGFCLRELAPEHATALTHALIRVHRLPPELLAPLGHDRRVPMPRRLVARFRPVLATLSPAAPLARLVAALATIECVPLALLDPARPPSLSSVVGSLLDAPLETPPPSLELARPSPPAGTGRPGQGASMRQLAGAGGAESCQAGAQPSASDSAPIVRAKGSKRPRSERAAVRTRGRQPAAEERASGDLQSGSNASNASPGAPELRPTSPPDARGTEPTPDRGSSVARDALDRGETFFTTQAGWFYLVNFLHGREAARLLCADPAALEFPSGWCWLLALGRGLGLRPDPGLLAFVAFASELDDPAALERLPPLPHLAALLEHGRACYERFGLWEPALFERPGRVETSVGHVDVCLPMSAVSLDVRRAGLDVDPGWVPWLGRVVRFHYLDTFTAGGRA